MKSLTTISTTNTRRISLAALLALLALSAIGAGLARELRLNGMARVANPAISVSVPAPLDAHERYMPANVSIRVDPAQQSVLDYLRAHKSVPSHTTAMPVDAATQSVLDYLRAHAAAQPGRTPAQAAGHERFAALKQHQAEQKMDSAMENEITSAAPVINERFAALKARQAEARDATFVAASTGDAGRERFAELKARQVEQIMNPAMGNVLHPRHQRRGAAGRGRR
jgi:hypothetical protein